MVMLFVKLPRHEREDVKHGSWRVMPGTLYSSAGWRDDPPRQVPREGRQGPPTLERHRGLVQPARQRAAARCEVFDVGQRAPLLSMDKKLHHQYSIEYIACIHDIIDSLV